MRANLFRILLSAGLFLLVLSIGTFSQPSAVQAQPPRPTVPPTATAVPPVSTETPAPVATPRSSGGSSKSEPATGRLTGTVIDQTTGAPVAGVSVTIGEYTVVTDANGNYDFPEVPAGNYLLALAPTEQQGVAAQEPIAVTVVGGETLVQHLALVSPVAPTAVVPAEPEAPAPTAAPVPAELPRTGGEQGSLALLWAGLALIASAFAVHRWGASNN